MKRSRYTAQEWKPYKLMIERGDCGDYFIIAKKGEINERTSASSVCEADN